MSEAQIWLAMYLAIGAIAYYNDLDGDRKAFAIILWPICIITSMMDF